LIVALFAGFDRHQNQNSNKSHLFTNTTNLRNGLLNQPGGGLLLKNFWTGTRLKCQSIILADS